MKIEGATAAISDTVNIIVPNNIKFSGALRPPPHQFTSNEKTMTPMLTCNNKPLFVFAQSFVAKLCPNQLNANIKRNWHCKKKKITLNLFRV